MVRPSAMREQPPSDRDRLLEAFEAGLLLRPDPAVPNLVDLGRAFAAAMGVPALRLTPAAAPPRPAAT